MSRNLTLFTNTFPYGPGENFLEEEISYTFPKFKQVDIYPLYIPDGEKEGIHRSVPQNATVHRPLLRCDHKDRKGLIRDGFFCTAPFGFAVKAFLKDKVFLSGRKCWLWANYLFILRAMLSNGERMAEVEKSLMDSAVAYFYWGDKSALAIPFLKERLRRRGAESPAFVVRFHGSDLYEEARGYLPFREMLYGAVDEAVTISENGKEYIRSRYRTQPGNISVHHLGSFHHSDACPNLGAPTRGGEGPADLPGAYNLLSCSNVIELKRVHLIAQALLILERDAGLAQKLEDAGVSHICWTHIGGGPLLEPLKSFIIENGIEPEDGQEKQEKTVPVAFNFTGALPHEAVIGHYMTHYTDLFLQVSRSEGIPVSIMEALSFGTPVLATDVGGVSEIIPQGSSFGTLLPADLNPEKLAAAIREHLLKSIGMPEFDLALAARNAWAARWDSEKNYTEFAAFLEKAGNGTSGK